VAQWIIDLGLAASDDEVWLQIADGVLLCSLVARLGFHFVRPIYRHDLHLRNMDNISAFLEALPQLGLAAYQIPVMEDVLEFRSDIERQAKVVECLHLLYQLHQHPATGRMNEDSHDHQVSPAASPTVANESQPRGEQRHRTPPRNLTPSSPYQSGRTPEHREHQRSQTPSPPRHQQQADYHERHGQEPADYPDDDDDDDDQQGLRESPSRSTPAPPSSLVLELLGVVLVLIWSGIYFG
jgi:hypothetical protein